MSELKVASCFEFEKVLRGKSNKLFYPKSEVDAVIAELKAEIKRRNKKYAFALSILERYKSLSDTQTALDTEDLYDIYIAREAKFIINELRSGLKFTAN